MDTYLIIVYALLAASYLLYLIMIIILAELQVFTLSPFFLFGGEFDLLGVRFNNPSLFNGLAIFFFFNSLMSTFNYSVISPIFSRIMYASPNDPALPEGVSQRQLFIILTLFNIWSVVRSLFNLLGLLSNISFFIATSAGFLIGDWLTKYVYITSPTLFNFHGHAHVAPSEDDDSSSSLQEKEYTPIMSKLTKRDHHHIMHNVIF